MKAMNRYNSRGDFAIVDDLGGFGEILRRLTVISPEL